MKKIRQFSLIITLLLSLSGCALVQMGQESAEKVKTSTTHGYHNGVEPDKIRNFKDYLVDENDVVILAEDDKHTVFKLRNYDLGGRLDMITDPADYCEEKGGTVQYGKQVASFVYTEFDSIDFEFSSAKSDFKKKRKRSYKGWMRCHGTDDDFEILRSGRSKYFMVYHEKKQLQGYSMRWFIDYLSLEEVDPDTNHIGGWDYNAFVNLAGSCVLHKGKATISNRYTHKKEMDLNAYFIQQLNPRSGKKPYLLAQGKFSCQESENPKANVIFDISYMKKYRSLIYTKRQ
jgi:hypothetical protein